jgi:ABC-type transporter Mla subunit MlaD
MRRGLRQTRRLVIGFILILAILVVWILIFFLEKIVLSARDTYSIVGIFFEAPRLRVGSPVWIAGHPAGVVTRIELLPPTEDSIPPFAATLQIVSRLQPEIRRDSRIRLQQQRFMGEPVVDLMPGSPRAPILQPGDTLRATPPPRSAALVARGRALSDQIDSLFAEGAMLREKTRRSASFVGEIETELERVRTDFRALTDQFGTGPLPDFLADEGWRRALERIGRSAGEIDSLARARMLVLTDTLARSALDDLSRQVAELTGAIAELRATLEEPRGFPARWEEDPAIRNAIEGVRVRVDALIDFARHHPWRFFF